MAQDFSASAPNQIRAGDIPYLWIDEGWLYLAVVTELSSRRVIGWAMSERMMAQLVCDALQMALFRRKQPQCDIVHSDRGLSVLSLDYQSLLNAYGLRCSISAKVNCYSESFFYSIKVQVIHGEGFTTRAQM